MDSLPDELVKEILTLAVIPPEETFNARPTECSTLLPVSSAVVLLVCKQYLRIATPLLYEVVILRSKGQANALDRALQKDGAALGLHVKKLRLEGGYGAPIGRILKLTPNIKDIYLSLEIYSTDSASGLFQSLREINPVSVWLYHSGYSTRGTSANSIDLAAALKDCMTVHWTNMSIFGFPGSRYSRSSIADYWLDVLKHCKNVREVYSPASTLIVDALALLPAIQIIRINHEMSGPRPIPAGNDSDDSDGLINYVVDNRHHIFDEHVQSRPKLASLVKFREPKVNATASVVPIADVSGTGTGSISTPMQDVSDAVQEKIWNNVIQFVAPHEEHGARQLSKSEESWETNSDNLSSQLLSLQLVSKRFHRLCTPWFYKHPVFADLESLELFISRLKEDATLAPYMNSCAIRSFHSPEKWHDSVNYMFTHAVHLSRCSSGNWDHSCDGDGSPIPWQTFITLLETTSASGQHRLHTYAGPSIEASLSAVPASIISHQLCNIRFLYWDCQTEFEEPAEAASTYFPALEELHLFMWSTSFINILTYANLPMLRTFRVPGSIREVYAFVQKHAPKVRELHIAQFEEDVYRQFTSLEELYLLRDITRLDKCLNPTLARPSQALRKIKVSVFTNHVDHVHRSNYKQTELPIANEWKLIFESFNYELFPALRELQIGQSLWPPLVTQEIAKSPWPKVSEALEDHNIRLFDKDGKSWKRRVR